MNRMGYQAITLGELELERGDEYVRELVKQFKAKVVLSNVGSAAGTVPWDETAVIEVAGHKVGILGLLSASFGRGTEALTVQGWTVEDPFAAMARLLPGLRQRADLVIALAHLEPGEVKRIGQEGVGLDLIIQGHQPNSANILPDSAVTTVLRPGQRGEYLGKVALKGGKFSGPDAIMLDMSKIGEDTKMAKELAELKSSIEAENRRAQLQREIESNEGIILGQERYLGEATCARCHSSSVAELANNPHAHAFATLEKMGKAEDKSCLPCHVTGYEAPGGFGAVGTTAVMKNVQCESCHGMGTGHDWTGATAGPAESTCLQCHVPEWSPKWNYSAYLKRLGHGLSKS
jgi:2',3'-cyclic-nucleotide 2'-phosphodiesterase (5'-nucleotidase family)